MTTTRHYSMRIDSALFEQVQKYAEATKTNVREVVEESLRLLLPKPSDKTSCRIRCDKLDKKKVKVRCELFIPSWSKLERWESVVSPGQVEEKIEQLQSYAQEWVKKHLDIESIEVEIED